MGLRLLLALALTGIVQGCSTTPAVDPQNLPIPARYPLAENPSAEFSIAGSITGDISASRIAWEQLLPDPRLQRLMTVALENNRDLRITALRVEEARAAWGIQRADVLPSFSIAANGSRSLTPGDINRSGQPLTLSQYQVGVGLNPWEIDLWGRVRNLNQAALQNYFSADEMRYAATLSLFTQLSQGYLGLLELNERLALARSEVATRAETLRIFTRRFEVGSASKLELAQVQVLSTQADALVAQLEQQRAQQLHGLTLLAGAPIDDLLQDPTLPLLDTISMADIAAGLPAELLTARPDLIAAEHSLRAAQANVAAARAAFFPRITLTGNFGTASAELEGLFSPGSRAWNWSPSVSLPIFTAGRLRASLDVAQLRREQAVAAYEQRIQIAFRDVVDALSARQWLARQLQIQQEALSAQRERARLARLRYDAGSATFLEVLDAQRDLLSAEQLRAQTRSAWLSAHIALFAALGGGSRTLAPTAR